MGRPKVRTEALRGELLSVATGLLSSGGSAALTTRAVAAGAGSSLAAVNELFGGKAGLVRAIFAEGFTRLAEDLSALRPGDDPEADVLALAFAFRAFAHRHPNLYEVMFSRPFAEFRPDEEDLRAAIETRRIVVDRVAALPGVTHPKDAALGLFAVIQGLVGLETAGLLGSTPESVTRRYHLTVSATVRGLTTPPTTTARPVTSAPITAAPATAPGVTAPPAIPPGEPHPLRAAAGAPPGEEA